MGFLSQRHSKRLLPTACSNDLVTLPLQHQTNQTQRIDIIVDH